jgi:hypothetical protein
VLRHEVKGKVVSNAYGGMIVKIKAILISVSEAGEW